MMITLISRWGYNVNKSCVNVPKLMNFFFIISLRGRVKKIIKINIIEYFLIDKKKKLRNWINQSNLKIISII